MTQKSVPMVDIYFLLLFIVWIAFGITLVAYYGNLIAQCAYYPHISFFKTLGVRNYGAWFIVTSIISFVIIAIELYRDRVIDRAIWASTLFFCIGMMCFFGNIPFVTYYYDLYAWTTFFLSLVCVGIITTFFSPAEFVGVVSEDKKAVRCASLKLLGISIACFVWSVWTGNYGLSSFLYIGLPAALWRFFYDRLGKKIRGETLSVFKW